ncbi:hypothetical protein EVAR_102797_1 [Eumeta japonica]|uniref:Uncharacterized protein n=1 Tax=Eumeta variegata TaxID=151549 RepID=A0A4C1TL69_EUMVA|nr:hypothetical protein EVAR_102797_1 [Eumeta japonica]
MHKGVVQGCGSGTRRRAGGRGDALSAPQYVINWPPYQPVGAGRHRSMSVSGDQLCDIVTRPADITPARPARTPLCRTRGHARKSLARARMRTK